MTIIPKLVMPKIDPYSSKKKKKKKLDAFEGICVIVINCSAAITLLKKKKVKSS